jgi:hypothetical protein
MRLPLAHGFVALFLAGLLVLAGCEEPGTSVQNSIQTVTFKTAEPAPDGFDAWDFVWKGPKRAPNINLESVVLDPAGNEYARQEFVAYPGKSDSVHSSFSAGFAGGDPKVFYHQPIRISFRVARGGLLFLPSDILAFKFRFFKKDAHGDVDWRKPFQALDAVQEP